MGQIVDEVTLDQQVGFRRPARAVEDSDAVIGSTDVICSSREFVAHDAVPIVRRVIGDDRVVGDKQVVDVGAVGIDASAVARRDLRAAV